MAETGLQDFAQAKHKAAAHLHAEQTRNLPSNQEIEQALLEHQRLFRSEQQNQALFELRHQAIQAMRLLDCFQPRLVGAVLNGTADRHSPISLHLFAQTPEEVGLFLQEHNIPFELDERRVKFGNGNVQSRPLYRFVAGENNIELTVFPEQGLRQAPLNPVDGKPHQRAAIEQVCQLNET